jgi:hypothetical protein
MIMEAGEEENGGYIIELAADLCSVMAAAPEAD